MRIFTTYVKYVHIRESYILYIQKSYKYSTMFLFQKQILKRQDILRMQYMHSRTATYIAFSTCLVFLEFVFCFFKIALASHDFCFSSIGKEVCANNHNSFVTCVLYHPSDSNVYLSGTSNDGIYAWDVRMAQVSIDIIKCMSILCFLFLIAIAFAMIHPLSGSIFSLMS